MKDRVVKLVFYPLMLVLVWVVVEVAAVAGHAVLDGRLFSPRSVRQQAGAVAARAPVAALEAAGPESAREAAAGDRFAGRWTEVIHPYFGVVVDPDRHPAGAVSDLGFVESAPAEALLRPDPDTVTIGIFGGSFAAGIYRRSARTAIGQDGRETLTVNFAKGGYKQPQQLLVLAYLLALGVRLDVVVNVDGFNEVALPPVENVARGVNPFYPRQWHLKARGVLDPETVRKIGYLEYLEGERSRRAGRLLESGLYRSPTLALLWRAADRRRAASVLDARRQVDRADAEDSNFKLVRRSWPCLASAGISGEIVASLRPLRGRSFDRRDQLHEAVAERIGVGRAAEHRQAVERCTARVSASYAAFGPKYDAASDDELYRDLAGMWQRSSFEMKALCDAYGIRYFHFLQPNQYLPESKPITSEERRIAINPAQHYRRGVVHGYPLLRESGRRLIERGVAFTDLTMLFEHDSEVRYADDCCHLNKGGYGLVLDRILETIARESAPGTQTSDHLR